MKKIIASILILASLNSCENEQSVKSDIDRLKNQRQTIQSEVNRLTSVESSKSKKVDELNEELKALNIYKSGETPKYILKIKLKQSRVSLSIKKHIKDAANAIEFEIPVSKEFYDHVNIGTEITDDFRFGSFVLNGTFSSWNMKVVKKSIKK